MIVSWGERGLEVFLCLALLFSIPVLSMAANKRIGFTYESHGLYFCPILFGRCHRRESLPTPHSGLCLWPREKLCEPRHLSLWPKSSHIRNANLEAFKPRLRPCIPTTLFPVMVLLLRTRLGKRAVKNCGGNRG